MQSWHALKYQESLDDGPGPSCSDLSKAFRSSTGESKSKESAYMLHDQFSLALRLNQPYTSRSSTLSQFILTRGT